MILIFTIPFAIILWFMMVRPQQQRMREHRELVENLAVGDGVITAGGIHGHLTEVGDDTVRIEVAEGVILTLARPAVAKMIPTPSDDEIDDEEPDASDAAEETGS